VPGHVSCLAPTQHDSEQHALRLASRGTREKGGTAGLERPTQGVADGPQGTPGQQGQPGCYSSQPPRLLAKVTKRAVVWCDRPSQVKVADRVSATVVARPYLSGQSLAYRTSKARVFVRSARSASVSAGSPRQWWSRCVGDSGCWWHRAH
jgi:hypothetical protein